MDRQHVTDTDCGSTRYAPRRPCEGTAKFSVVYKSPKTGATITEHRACFVHGLAEVDRHAASAGIAGCELVEMTHRPECDMGEDCSC